MAQMNLHELEEQLGFEYTRLEGAIIKYREGTERIRVAEMALKMNIANALYNGDIIGKNQAIRDAEAKELFVGQYNLIENEKKINSQHSLEYEIAQIKVAYLRAILRIKELSQIE